MPGHQEKDAAIERLAALVLQRRAAMGWSKEKAADDSGVARMTYRRIEDGERVQAASYAKVERGLGIAAGACKAVLDGAPSLLLDDGSELLPGARITPITGSVADEVMGGVADAAILTTPGLTGHEIRALGDQVVTELRKRGIIPELN